MGRRLATAVIAAACVFLLHTGQCDATRTLKDADEYYSAYALPPASGGASWRGEAAAGAGKWLPVPGSMRFPAIPGASIPWLAVAPPAFPGAGLGLPLVPPFVGATRQEQLSMWAQLFNPWQRPARLPVAEGAGEPQMPVSGGGTAVDGPSGVQIGEPKWNFYVGNNGN